MSIKEYLSLRVGYTMPAGNKFVFMVMLCVCATSPAAAASAADADYSAMRAGETAFIPLDGSGGGRPTTGTEQYQQPRTSSDAETSKGDLHLDELNFVATTPRIRTTSAPSR